MKSFSLLLPLLLLAVFYFLLVRPQQRRVRAQAQVVSSLQVGAEVVTTAGLHAVVKAVLDDSVLLEVAPGVVCRYVKQAVMRIESSSDDDAAGAGGGADGPTGAIWDHPDDAPPGAPEV